MNGVPFKVQGVFQLDPNSSNLFSFEKRAYVPLQQAHKLSDELDIVPLVTIQTNNTDQLQGAAEKLQRSSINRSRHLIMSTE